MLRCGIRTATGALIVVDVHKPSRRALTDGGPAACDSPSRPRDVRFFRADGRQRHVGPRNRPCAPSWSAGRTAWRSSSGPGRARTRPGPGPRALQRLLCDRFRPHRWHHAGPGPLPDRPRPRVERRGRGGARGVPGHWWASAVVADNLVTCGAVPRLPRGAAEPLRRGWTSSGSASTALMPTTWSRSPASVRVLPPGVSLRAAALAEPLGVALYGDATGPRRARRPRRSSSGPARSGCSPSRPAAPQAPREVWQADLRAERLALAERPRRDGHRWTSRARTSRPALARAWLSRRTW